MLRLRATDESVVLSQEDSNRVVFLLSEFLPTSKVRVENGPGVQFTVKNRVLADLGPAILERIERIVGCPMTVEGDG